MSANGPEWGSDVVADFLRQADVRYVALNPGASYRGLHDSLVNYLGAEDPAILMCLHEEHAVALAHGYAKVTGFPMAVALHSNVGLMHASMAIYNAWADRAPVFMIGANGPLDASRRRPWIDWIHSSADQAALVRNYVKWDDQPVSVEATLESLVRAWDIVRTPPMAPTYVVLDTTMQESKLEQAVLVPELTGMPVVALPVAPADVVQLVADALLSAKSPVLLMGRMSKSPEEWKRRVMLAEAVGARVITDLKAGASFPMVHPAHVAGPSFFLSGEGAHILRGADVVVAFDWIDLGGTLAQAPAEGQRMVVNISQDAQLHNGWSKDHFRRIPADLTLPIAPDTGVAQLVAVLPEGSTVEIEAPDAGPAPVGASGEITLPLLAWTLRDVMREERVTLARLPLGWDGDFWPFAHPLDSLGYDGGGGIGSGPGMLVGAALALRESDRIAVGVLGDGDYLMGVQALWTAARYSIPLIAIVSNNRSYFNDEVHQQKVAEIRGRDVSRKWVGQRIDDPAPDLAALARAQGLEGLGPITRPSELRAALTEALRLYRAGRAVVIDVVVETGYSPAMAAGLARDA
ncbi:thiamine pyrophosphate-binding protein [Subtercola lobariae]|uniref:Thiamine pyrophosphate-binding protein n=1 Tax=Subtercola lobariae TaxID=1588641 RepID=A0A917BDV0_9MICO|nr:thiamine pyrophosphate-binding protein [Subtercola lobariae]GGF38132.1 thiamine pyrophosphate-binding protein [Subtercola lobariae]